MVIARVIADDGLRNWGRDQDSSRAGLKGACLIAKGGVLVQRLKRWVSIEVFGEIISPTRPNSVYVDGRRCM